MAGCAQRTTTTTGGQEEADDQRQGGSRYPAENEGAKGEKTVTLNDEKANDHGSEDVTGEADATVAIEIHDFYFEPTVIKGDPGQSIELDLSNEGPSLHSFQIDEQNVGTDIAADEATTETVTIPDDGTVLFYCKYHRSSGMLGGLQAA
ncbi:MAG: cupredoxin domain-containing protein [Actinomycetota bacterium]